MRRSWRSCCAPICCPKRGSPRLRCGRCGRCCATASSWCGCAPCWATGSTPSPPVTAMTARPDTGAARAGLACLDLPPASRQVIDDDLALIGALAGRVTGLDGQVHQRAKAEPGVKVVTQLPGVGEFTALVILAGTGGITRFGPARKLAAWAGLTPIVGSSGRTV